MPILDMWLVTRDWLPAPHDENHDPATYRFLCIGVEPATPSRRRVSEPGLRESSVHCSCTAQSESVHSSNGRCRIRTCDLLLVRPVRSKQNPDKKPHKPWTGRTICRDCDLGMSESAALNRHKNRPNRHNESTQAPFAPLYPPTSSTMRSISARKLGADHPLRAALARTS